MTPSDNEQSNPRDRENEKTVILQRCPKHGTLYMPNEGCPECAKEKNAG